MASTGDLQKKMKRLAEVSDRLWSSFSEAESSFSIPFLRPIKAHKTAWPLAKSGKIRWHEYFPMHLVLTYIFAFSVFFDKWFLLPYTAFITMSFFSFDRYKNAVVAEILRTNDFVPKAFGVDNISLTIFGIMKKANSEGEKIKKEDLAAIIKLEKSKQENEDVSTGFADSLKKALYTLAFAAPFAIPERLETLGKGVDFATKVYDKNIYVFLYVVFVVACLFYIVFELIVIKTQKKKREKRYLLILNILHESWV